MNSAGSTGQLLWRSAAKCHCCPRRQGSPHRPQDLLLGEGYSSVSPWPKGCRTCTPTRKAAADQRTPATRVTAALSRMPTRYPVGDRPRCSAKFVRVRFRARQSRILRRAPPFVSVVVASISTSGLLFLVSIQFLHVPIKPAMVSPVPGHEFTASPKIC